MAAVLDDAHFYVPPVSRFRASDALFLIREALTDRRRLTFDYSDEQGRHTSRVVRPLGVFFWGRTWTLAAWCETRRDFRNFRIDRITNEQTSAIFSEEPGKTLRDLLTRYGPDAVRLLER